jgi:hypothetical protein
MLNFCTLFDSVYLSRGLVMYNSLKEHTDDFHLYIFAFDDLCYKILYSLNLENVTIVPLKLFENDELLEVKKSRSRAEYCWTCTSSSIEYVLTNYNVPSCTYIDADLFFYNSPAVLCDELTDGKSVLITEHRYSAISRLYEQKRAGRFCVQFITFINQPDSRRVLTDWKGKCLDWCYNRYEDGKFGDQKYLDEWPEKFKNVHIMNHLGGGVAPWNVQQYQIFVDNGQYLGIEKTTKTKFDLIFFHFHFVRFLADGSIDLGWNFIGKSIINTIYLPYIVRILETEIMLSKISSEYRTTYSNINPVNLKDHIKTVIKEVSKFNIVKSPNL